MNPPPSLRTQLDEANRVVDMANGPVYLSMVAEWAYYLKRARPHGHGIIDAVMPAPLARDFTERAREMHGQVYCSFPNPDGLTRFMRQSPPVMGMPCIVFDLPDAAVELAVFQNEMMPEGSIWFIDWSGVVCAPRVPSSVTFLHPDRHLIVENVAHFCCDQWLE